EQLPGGSPAGKAVASGGAQRMPWQTLGAVLLAAALLGPFALSKLHPQLEPFPAVILPSGAFLASADAEARSFSIVSTWARRVDGEAWEPVDPVALIDPALPQYLPDLVRRHFGLRPVPDQQLQLRGTPWQWRAGGRYSRAAAEETAIWLQRRLHALGYDPKELRVTEEHVQYRTADFEPIEREIRRENVYRLD
ncbi:MAG TPA: hypothetical protein VHF69_06195, partial [Candidatus Synoicihabitans sp.]|nr:hypothetical protein [Candidatus Synoicihabitans sp.]